MGQDLKLNVVDLEKINRIQKKIPKNKIVVQILNFSQKLVTLQNYLIFKKRNPKSASILVNRWNVNNTFLLILSLGRSLKSRGGGVISQDILLLGPQNM